MYTIIMKHTLNAAEMKIRNRATVLRLIRQNGYSRAQISRETGLTRAAVTFIVDECIGKGMIAEGEKSDAQVGRRAVGLKMDPQYGWTIGLNISRRAYTIGIVDFSGKILREFCKEISMDKKPAALLDDICAHICEMSAGMVGKFLGIGITMPGPLDREKGVLLRVPNMREWENFAVSEYFERRFHCAVVLDNNSNAAAKAEEVYNPAVQGKNFMELIVDSGLGSSIILNADNHSVCFDCEFGHSCIDINGERCSCGNIGCAEMYASANAILAFVSKKGGTFGTWKDIADGFLLNDELCKLAVERERYYLSRVIINAVNSFPLDAVVFSGDIVYRFEKLFAEPLKQEVFEGSIKNNRVQMFVSAMKNTPVLAAANLIMENCLYFDSAQC